MEISSPLAASCPFWSWSDESKKMHALKKYVYRNKTFEMSQDYQKELGNAYKKKTV